MRGSPGRKMRRRFLKKKLKRKGDLSRKSQHEMRSKLFMKEESNDK